ncbi:MAG TPA: sugar ABC transporter ATP-binding protein [Fimbriimonadaceae bacterium]|nr:sugar ABC transporter ATP-binding protein [Fimbriimonadaceae bacterium]
MMGDRNDGGDAPTAQPISPSGISPSPHQGIVPLVEVRGAVKRYPGVTALGGVSMRVFAGEVVALIGENGAGKSTLMKILGGLVRADEGEILIDGKPVAIGSVSRSVELGIGLIHQELNTLDNLDVAGNIFLGREPTRFGLLDRVRMRSEASALLERLALPISVDTPLERLSLAQKQMVEIAKALSLNARVLIMDEPTSSLTLAETEQLLGIVQELRDKGVGIVYISHRLGEVKGIADRVVALRDGLNAGDLSREEITHEAMVRLMVGRDLDRMAEREGASGSERLVVTGLRTSRYPGRDVSFSVRSGEILCLAGLVGAGRTEVVQAIFGTDPRVGGHVALDGVEVPASSPKGSIDAGIGLVPEDRREVGLIVEWSVKMNVTLPGLAKLATGGLIRGKAERQAAASQTSAFNVKTPDIETTVATLSGGNQQKVVVAKWMLQNPKLLIMDEPTRGVDVGAKAEIYELMRRLTAQGVAIVMVSSDMEEVLGVADRVAVMCEGSITGILPRRDCTEEGIMRLAVGRGE